MSFGDKLQAETCQFIDARLRKASGTEHSVYSNLQVCTQLYVEHNSTQEADYLCGKHLRAVKSIQIAENVQNVRQGNG
jgi:hypothetical protein